MSGHTEVTPPPDTPVSGWIRAGVSLVAILCALLLFASWLLIGMVGKPLALEARGLGLALLVTLLAMALAASATAIAWRANAARATELLAAFMIALAFGFAWRLFRTGEIQNRLLDDVLIPWMHHHYAGAVAAKWLNACDWALVLFDECANLALMLAAVLFLLFSEQFPKPLPPTQLAQSIARQMVWPWLRKLKVPVGAVIPRRRVGIVESSFVFICTSIAMATVIAVRANLAWAWIDGALMLVLTGVIVAAGTVYLVRRVERSAQPWSFERWLTTDPPEGPPRWPLSSMTLCFWLALAIALFLSEIQREKTASGKDLVWLLLTGAMLLPGLLLRVRAVRAEWRPAFWFGWMVTVIAASPHLMEAVGEMGGTNARSYTAVLWWTFVCSLAACGNLIVGYRNCTVDDRRRIFWLLVGIVLSCVAMVAITLAVIACALFKGACRDMSPMINVILFAPAILLVVCMLFAVFYRGAIDPRLALQKSVTYLLIGLVVSAVFTTLEILLEHLLTEVSGPDTSKWVAAGITFTVINPTKHACERAVESGAELLLRVYSISR